MLCSSSGKKYINLLKLIYKVFCPALTSVFKNIYLYIYIYNKWHAHIHTCAYTLVLSVVADGEGMVCQGSV